MIYEGLEEYMCHLIVSIVAADGLAPNIYLGYRINSLKPSASVN